MTLKRKGASLQKAAAWAPAGTPQPRFALPPLTRSGPEAPSEPAAAHRPASLAPAVGLDFASQPARSQALTLPPVFSGMRASTGPAEALPDRVDLPLATARRSAAQAARSSAVPLPFGERIQQSFGRFDVQGVRAHLGGTATASARSLGARAFAAGEHVVFSGRPDLHTAAHEAAHVVQQRAGVVPADGIGRPGDRHERHADAVADRVATGQKAEPLLHRFAGTWDASRALPRPAAAAPAVQRVIDEQALGAALAAAQIGGAFAQYKKWLINDTGSDWSSMDTGYAISRVDEFKAALARRVDLDFEQDVKGGEIDLRRARVAPIFSAPLRYVPDSGELAPSGGAKLISRLPASELVPLLENWDQYYDEKIQGIPKRTLVFRNGNQPGQSLAFFRKDQAIDPAELGKELLVRYHILFDEPEARTGEQRAAADAQQGAQRAPSDTEAAYAPAVRALGPPNGTRQYQVGQYSRLTIEMGANRIRNTMVHQGPWTKGSRTPGQSAVMGGQSAKNYVIDQVLPGRSEQEKEAARGQLRGRYEWLHIVGSSLGGPNLLGNLVAGTYDANTKMIALEHRVALWAPRDYQTKANAQAAAAATPAPASAVATTDAMNDTEMKDAEVRIAINPRTPLTIVGTADLRNNTFMATRIRMTVTHGTTQLASGDYRANDTKVITKSQYAAEKQRVEEEISAARGT